MNSSVIASLVREASQMNKTIYTKLNKLKTILANFFTEKSAQLYMMRPMSLQVSLDSLMSTDKLNRNSSTILLFFAFFAVG
jgi:hypothetical protein